MEDAGLDPGPALASLPPVAVAATDPAQLSADVLSDSSQLDEAV
jgi:hypothetical protein